MPRDPLFASLSVRDQLVEEVQAMLKHALAGGLDLPPEIVPLVPRFDASAASAEAPSADDPSSSIAALSTAELLTLHESLAKRIAPAKPLAVLMFARESLKRGFLMFLGPVPLARRLTVAAIFCLVGAIATSLSPYVGEGSGNIFQMSGLPLLVNQLFLLTAAGLGASFSGLMRVNRSITDATIDPKDEATYWIRFVLGLIGGMILAQLLHVESTDTVQHDLGRPTLAMLGGFSADLVYRILERLMEFVEGIVRNDTKQIGAAKEELAATKVSQDLVQERLQLATRLLDLRQQVGDEESRAAIQRLVGELLPTATTPAAASPAAGPPAD